MKRKNQSNILAREYITTALINWKKWEHQKPMGIMKIFSTVSGISKNISPF